MKALSRSQKIILAVLAVLDVLVIAGLGGIVFVSIRMMPTPEIPLPATEIAMQTSEAVATWTPTITTTPRPTTLPRLTDTPQPTATPFPTKTPTPTATPRPLPTPGPVPLNGGDFDFLLVNRIPGWTWDAYVNYKPGADFDPNSSFAEPTFSAADDPARRINGSTLKVETIRWLKFRTWIHQTVTVTAGSTVQFSIKAQAYSSQGQLIVKAGVDPTGQDHCYDARWGQEMHINQDSGTVLLKSPSVVVPEKLLGEAPTAEPTGTPDPREPDLIGTPVAEKVGQVTICFYAEPAYAHINNAAFFDQAELIASPPRQ